eukprot:353791-Chlamydomonas_euryale.AAC.7
MEEGRRGKGSFDDRRGRVARSACRHVAHRDSLRMVRQVRRARRCGEVRTIQRSGRDRLDRA